MCITNLITSDAVSRNPRLLVGGDRSPRPMSIGESNDRLKLLAIIVAAGLCYFLVAWLRYAMFRAGALDLGLWDQTMYLISKGQVPYSTIVCHHMMADHAAVVLYAIGQLYRIYPSVCWLLALQAGCMAGAAWPLWRLARDRGIQRSMARALIVAYLLYPVIASAATRDFYPEALVVPALLAMILCARRRRPGWFVFWMLLGLSTKEVMSVTFAATGLYLAISERRRAYGLACFALSVAWFLIATRLIMPHFGQGHQFTSAPYLRYLGDSPRQIARTFLLKPWIPLNLAFKGKSAVYLPAIFLPVIWGLSPGKLIPLLCAVPCLTLNLFLIKPEFRDLTYHYSWPIVPFLFLAIIEALAAGRGWFDRGRWIVIWSIAAVVLALAARAATTHRAQGAAGATNSEKRQLIAMIDDDRGVIAPHQLASHLTHRQVIQFVYDPSDPNLSMPPDDQIDWVLLDFNENSMDGIAQFANQLLRKYEADPAFRQLYHHGALYLFHRERQR